MPRSRRSVLSLGGRALAGASMAGLAGCSALGGREAPAERWTYGTGTLLASQPVEVDGTVYVGGSNNDPLGGPERLHAVDAESGERRWEAPVGQMFLSPTVVDGTVYVGSRDGVYALDAADGSERWSAPTDVQYDPFVTPTVTEDTVYARGGQFYAFALDRANGEVRWEVQPGEADSARHSTGLSPVVHDGVVHVTGREGGLYGLDPASGETVWEADVSVYAWLGTVVSGTTLYLASRSGGVVAADLADRTVRTVRDRGYPFAVRDGTLYGNDDDGNVFAFDVDRTETTWRFTKSDVGGSVVSGETLLVSEGGKGGSLYALDTATGEERWSLALDGGVLSVLPFVNRKHVYNLGASDSSVYFCSRVGRSESTLHALGRS